ncbi:MAG TPA: hypothetical protein VFB04_05255 [Terriglobales bacterium]|nr:hypothetical protein [Terriglobales bacterium]
MTIEEMIKLMQQRQGTRNQAEYAKFLGISEAYLSDIYKRKREPGPSVARKFGLEKQVIRTVQFKPQVFHSRLTK